jgi:hypothetical protein
VGRNMKVFYHFDSEITVGIIWSITHRIVRNLNYPRWNYIFYWVSFEFLVLHFDENFIRSLFENYIIHYSLHSFWFNCEFVLNFRTAYVWLFWKTKLRNSFSFVCPLLINLFFFINWKLYIYCLHIIFIM